MYVRFERSGMVLNVDFRDVRDLLFAVEAVSQKLHGVENVGPRIEIKY